MLKLWKSPVSAEDVFLEHYHQLVGWALQIAKGDRELAEDLVHDAYIQFTSPVPTSIRFRT
jgi:DNA-directed RNA polymerase specialized sigma24 family protein